MKKSKGEETKEKILDAALKLWPNLTLRALGNATGLKHTAINYHFPNNSLKDEVARHAVAKGCSRIIVQLMAAHDPAIKRLTVAQRRFHFNAI